MRSFQNLALMTTTLAVLSGCSNNPVFPAPWTASGDEETTITMAREEPRRLLRCLGSQYEALSNQDTLLALGPIRHLGITASYTESHPLPLDATVVLQSLLSHISPVVRHVDMSATSPDVALKPAFVVTGGITFDTATMSAQSSADVGITIGNASVNWSPRSQHKTVELELVLNGIVGESGVGGYGLTSPVSVTFPRAHGKQQTFAASFSSVSMGFEPVTRQITSYGSGLELAAAHSLLVVLGRFWALPYWECTDGAVDTIVRNERIDRFRAIAEKGEAQLLRYLRLLLAYAGQFVDSDPAAIKAALEKRYSESVEDAEAYERVYWELILDVAAQPQQVLVAARQWEKRQ